ncbi:hypothetical protein BHE97_10270 [Aeromicrobium sp. PE09-221]|nr:hypothetical protein BHE97_10270 [Aeromicrobium sp. PE09-221]
MDAFDTDMYRRGMSAALYSLGRWCHRHAGRVIAGWVVVLAAAGGLAAAVGEGTHDDFTLPGTEGQEALDTLTRTFPQIAGISAQIVYIAPEGGRVDDPALREAAEATLERLDEMPLVDDALSPFDDVVDGTINTAGDAAIIQVQFSGGPSDITDQVKTDLREATEPLEAAGAEVELGGGAFMNTGPTITWMEATGVVVAFIVLWIALGSGRAAVMPVLTALIGVGVTMSLIWALTAVTHLASPTPLLALMIGLAVGIDYALFIVSRQREELGRGADPAEASGRAVATGGSAVVFAGITTLIALAGLAIARIPFLTWMGVTASASVAIAVVVAITLLPALMGLAGDRLRPRRDTRGDAPIARRWVRTVTAAPWVTLVVVVLALGALALPGRDLALALPGNGTAEEGSTERAAYDLVDEHFGPGFNSPILLTADIIDSLDPVGLMDQLGEEVASLDGVETVALSTPNPTADTGVVQFFPSTAADDPATADLVERLREAGPRFERDYGVATAVTGQTAMEIDVSEQLSSTLLPFGAFVVVLTLLLLTTVFRSVVVPVKAALGYLLSVGVSFGAVVLVFDRGWAADLLGVDHLGPVISFLPILLMGVLFGLAMDYELFLVSRMKEEFARDGDADRAIEAGFATSGRVVTAAAIVMLAVFIAFVPESDAMVKPIAFALAVGVFVDAFIVRMILVPAVMKLLGSRAWWIPSALDRSLPRLDVEGEALHERVARADWPGDGSRVAIESLTLPSGRVIDQWRTAESCVVVEGSARERAFVALTLSGRAPQADGTVRIDDLVLPFDAARLRHRSALLTATDLGRRRSVGSWMRGLGAPDPETRLTEVAARGLGPVPHLTDRVADLGPAVRAALAVTASSAHLMVIDLADLGEDQALRVVDACHDLLSADRILVATVAPGALSAAGVATLSLDPMPELMTV